MLTQNSKRIIVLVCIYIFARLLAFWFEPSSPLHTASPYNFLFSAIFAGATGLLLLKRNIWGWYLVAGEIILGGTGNYFEIFGVSLRTILLILSLSTFFVQERKQVFSKPTNLFLISFIFLITAIGAINGILHHHPIGLVISDTIPYLFLLYYFPLEVLIKELKFNELGIQSLKAAIVGQTIFILFTFYSFLRGYFILQNTFYHWYRDIASGKITFVEFNFYRLVLNEQLLIAPLLLYFIYKAIYNKSKESFIYIALLLTLLSVNLTRIYMVGIAIGCLFLFSRSNWKRWFYTITGSAFIFFIIFSSLSLIASQGRSFGFEMLGVRLQSIVTPQIEDSSLSRLLLLPKIFQIVMLNPIFGQGLGATVTVYSPVLEANITTPHFDWGYLEILAEIGLFGLIIWLAFIYKVFQKIKKPPHWQSASLVALLIINITSPALFHVFGFIWLALLLAVEDRAF